LTGQFLTVFKVVKGILPFVANNDPPPNKYWVIHTLLDNKIKEPQIVRIQGQVGKGKFAHNIKSGVDPEVSKTPYTDSFNPFWVCSEVDNPIQKRDVSKGCK
jgi:hypothetical protein